MLMDENIFYVYKENIVINNRCISLKRMRCPDNKLTDLSDKQMASILGLIQAKGDLSIEPLIGFMVYSWSS